MFYDQIENWEEYEAQHAACARGEHGRDNVTEEWAYEGDPDVPNGVVTFKVVTCHVCGHEWA
jgi:hypothetical protein